MSELAIKVEDVSKIYSLADVLIIIPTYNEKENVEKMDLVKTMFGKSVYRQTYTVRFETLKTIVYHSQEILVKEGVKLSDLV